MCWIWVFVVGRAIFNSLDIESALYPFARRIKTSLSLGVSLPMATSRSHLSRKASCTGAFCFAPFSISFVCCLSSKVPNSYHAKPMQTRVARKATEVVKVFTSFAATQFPISIPRKKPSQPGHLLSERSPMACDVVLLLHTVLTQLATAVNDEEAMMSMQQIMQVGVPPVGRRRSGMATGMNESLLTVASEESRL